MSTAEKNESFSFEVKKELTQHLTDSDKKYACLYGMILFCKHFSAENIIFQTENKLVADTFISLTEDLLGKKNVVTVTETAKKNNTVLYALSIENSSDREEIIYRFRISSRSLIHRIQDEVINHNNLFAFLSGAFLSCGSIIDPNKEYHLEFVIPYEELCGDLSDMLMSMGIVAKTTQRKGAYVLYIKGSETIEDLLTIMGATNCSLELMNVKILKDVRNKANRLANCDSANIDRIIKAAEKQIEDILFIDKAVGLDTLSPDLYEMAIVRMDNPEFSLKELGELLSKPLGRSGINHRLKKISEIAEKLREEYPELAENMRGE